GLGVRESQRPAAKAAIFHEGRNALPVAFLEFDSALHVRKLPDVEVSTVRFAPAEEDVGRSLDQALACDDPMALMIEWQAVTGIRFEYRRLRLFDLKEKRIVAIGAEKQYDPAGGADTANADHLAGDIDDPVARQQLAAVEGYRLGGGTRTRSEGGPGLRGLPG